MEEIKDEEDNERVLNNATYRRLLPEIIADHEGEWIVISKGELVGIYKNREEAINAVKSNKLTENCNIVSPITNKQRKITLGFGRKLK